MTKTTCPRHHRASMAVVQAESCRRAAQRAGEAGAWLCSQGHAVSSFWALSALSTSSLLTQKGSLLIIELPTSPRMPPFPLKVDCTSPLCSSPHLLQGPPSPAALKLPLCLTALHQPGGRATRTVPGATLSFQHLAQHAGMQQVQSY